MPAASSVKMGMVLRGTDHNVIDYVNMSPLKPFLFYGSRFARGEHLLIFNQRWGPLAQWFGYLAEEDSISNPASRRAVMNNLLQIIRRERAYCCLYLPKGTKKYFEDLRVGSRAKETSAKWRALLFLAKILRSYGRGKRISRIYVSTQKSADRWQRLKFLHGAEVHFLPRDRDIVLKKTASELQIK